MGDRVSTDVGARRLVDLCRGWLRRAVGDGPADPGRRGRRFNAELDAHHWLGHRLTGQVLRYVAALDGEWVALVGFGSAALSCAARDRFLGWSRETHAAGGHSLAQSRPGSVDADQAVVDVHPVGPDAQGAASIGEATYGRLCQMPGPDAGSRDRSPDEQLLEASRTGQVCEFSDGLPITGEDMAGWGADRTVSAALLRQLLLGEHPDCTMQRVAVRGAVIAGKLDVHDASVVGLALTGCRLGPIDLRRATFTGDARFDGTNLHRRRPVRRDYQPSPATPGSTGTTFTGDARFDGDYLHRRRPVRRDYLHRRRPGSTGQPSPATPGSTGLPSPATTPGS